MMRAFSVNQFAPVGLDIGQVFALTVPGLIALIIIVNGCYIALKLRVVRDLRHDITVDARIYRRMPDHNAIDMIACLEINLHPLAATQQFHHIALVACLLAICDLRNIV